MPCRAVALSHSMLLVALSNTEGLVEGAKAGVFLFSYSSITPILHHSNLLNLFPTGAV